MVRTISAIARGTELTEYTDLERIAAIEATSETRPSPKHDVLGVMTYIRQKLPSNPLDDVLRVEQEKTTVHCGPILESWIKSQRMATSRIGLEDEKRHLPDIVQTIVKEYQELGLDCEGLHGLAQGTSQANGHGDLDDGFMPEEERLFLNPPPMAVKPQPIQQARRKSTIPADFKQSSPILPTDLPIAFLLAELSRRLCSLFDRSFATITSSAQIDHVQHIMTWQPPDIEEDDALAVLGLARDPTKITTRLVRGDTNDAEPVSYIACETPQGCLPGVVTEEPACKSHHVISAKRS